MLSGLAHGNTRTHVKLTHLPTVALDSVPALRQWLGRRWRNARGRLMELTDFATLSFDCYGTLIDWERGLVEALRPWVERHGLGLDDEGLLDAFARAEEGQQAAAPGTRYPAILENTFRTMAEQLGRPVEAAELTAFGRSVKDWPAFPDSAAALAYLKRHYKLVILSNVDNASFRYSNERLGVAFDLIVTAEDVGSYKPNLGNFQFMLDRLAEMGVGKGELLHVAQSLFHDHGPARKLGLATCWINRRHDKPGWGATPPPPEPVTPDWEFPTLAAFADRHRALVGG
jgi:2-haloalkanoic acid dehalogenase type II